MYDHKAIEKKWKDSWREKNLYKTKEDSTKPKYYILDMFPYPSGSGLHVGHPKGYIATDIFARLRLMQGYNVLHPMGWDAFGLPAENFAIKNKLHPRTATAKNVATYKRQLELLGFCYDWEREINTTDPEYYKWTQWMFREMFNRGLVYESQEPINWCPSCKTGLANEDLEDGKCERCGSEIELKPLRQLVIQITAYADRLLADLDKLPDWEDSIKEMQRNWIGRSEGAEVEFTVKESAEKIKVFTTRVDTIFGCTYVVIAPENKLIDDLKDKLENWEEIAAYRETVKNKSALERTDLNKDKTGVPLKGIKAVNPFTGDEVSVFAADYVLNNYGTGAVMAVPAHDERDFEFAKKYNLPIKQVVAPHVIDEKNPPRDGFENIVRRVAHIILENEKEEVLTLNLKGEEWGKNKPKTLVIGGIEAGETPEITALREIREETGYIDVEVVKVLPIEFHAEFFAAHKNVNRYVKTTGVVCRLKSEKQNPVSAEEKKLHDMVWVKRSELPNFVTIPDDIFLAKAYLENSESFIEDGVLINSGAFTGLSSAVARQKMIAWLEENKHGNGRVNYKIKDWVFSRQRYWGEPIPIVHCPACAARIRSILEKGENPEDYGFNEGEVRNPGAIAVTDEQLPVVLPEVESYEPSGTGESPLATIKDWVNTSCPKCGGPATRETNTMPQWAGSSWYYLRYIDPKNDKVFAAKDKEKYWSPVDFYVGGAEHATRHLIYARFWHKFLFDIGAVSYDEPFTKLQHVGLIMGEDGRKMSKRWGNVINPDDIVDKFGADALRVYEMFMSPFADSCAWNTNGLIGARKFLDRVNNIVPGEAETDKSLKSVLHKTIKKVGEDIENFKFNTAVSQMMIFVNAVYDKKNINQKDFAYFILILAPFAPHLAEELWEKTGHKDSVFLSYWPEYSKDLIKDETINLVVQINGKVRTILAVPADIDEAAAFAAAQADSGAGKYLADAEIIKKIFVKGRLLNIVVK